MTKTDAKKIYPEGREKYYLDRVFFLASLSKKRDFSANRMIFELDLIEKQYKNGEKR